MSFDDIDDTQFVHLPEHVTAQLDRELSEEEELMDMLQDMLDEQEEES
jgi:hypothetical protein